MRIKKHNKTALLMGANELVGRKCLIQLLRNEAYKKVHLLLEEPLQFEHPKLDIHQINFEYLDRYEELLAVDDVFYCWGRSMLIRQTSSTYDAKKTYAYSLAKRARKAGAKQFIFLSSIAADSDNVLSYRRQQWELEEVIRELPYWAVHIFRPGILMEDDKPTFSKKILKNLGNRINKMAGGNLSKYKPVSAPHLGEMMVEKAQRFQEGIHIYSAEYIHAYSADQNEGITKKNG